MMENFNVGQKPPKITEKEKRFMDYRRKSIRYGNWSMRRLIQWCADWQAVTGMLLVKNSKTRDVGQAKIVDAAVRRKELAEFEKEGRFKK